MYSKPSVVDVDAHHSINICTIPNIALLIDPTPEQINSVAESCSDLFVFSFMTRPVDKDFIEKINKSHLIAMPTYLGHITIDAYMSVIRRYVMNSTVEWEL